MNVLRKQQGFMLVEVVVASVIISVALLGISSMFVQASRTVTDNGSTAIAVNYAQRQMEILKSKDDTWWKNVDHCSDAGSAISWQDTDNLPEAGYVVATTATNFTVGTTTLARVNVTVSWNEWDVKGTRKSRQITYATLYDKGS